MRCASSAAPACLETTTRALRLYEDECADGAGPAIACRKLALAIVQQRGEPQHSHGDYVELLKSACHRGDWLACRPPFAVADEAAARAACNAGEPAACLVAARIHFMSQSGTVDFANHQYLSRACQGRVLEACEDVVATPGGEPPTSEAVAVVSEACRAGDADACAAQRTPIPPTELCRAHDLRACADAPTAPSADPCAPYRPIRLAPAERPHVPPLEGRAPSGEPWHGPADRPYVATGAWSHPRESGLSEGAHALQPDVDTLIYFRQEVTPIPAAEVADIAPALGFTIRHDDEDRLLALRGHRGGTALVVDSTGVLKATLTIDHRDHVTADNFARCVRRLLKEP